MTRNGASIFAFDAGPHATTVYKVLRPCIDGVQGLVFEFAPVRNKTPFHGLHNKRIGVPSGISSRIRMTNDRRLSSRSDIISRNELGLVFPFLDDEVVAFQLLDIVALVAD